VAVGDVIIRVDGVNLEPSQLRMYLFGTGSRILLLR
jgi:hypothetical protein